MLPLERPSGRGKAFNGDVDLVGMRTWYFAPDSGEVTEVQEMPTELTDDVRRYHTELVEAVAELHDELLERYLNGEEPNAEELVRNLHEDFDAGKLVPVMFGAARANLAVRPLLDVFVNLFPSPADRAYPEMRDVDSQEEVPLIPDSDASAVITVFKTFSDPYLGKISVFRVLRGTITADMHLVDTRTGLDERVGRLVRLIGTKTMPVDKLVAGDIGAVAKLKDAQTGDTLSASGHHQRQLHYPMPRVTPAIWSVAIAPANKQDEAKLAIALAKLKEEDPALEVTIEPRTHRTVLAGQGEAHLELMLSRLANRHNIKVTRAEPQIPYRETITGTSQGQGRHKKQTVGRGQFGDVWLKIEPLPRGTGFEFVDEVVGGAVPRNYIPAVEKGVREMLDHGLLAGYPIVDMRVTLFDGSSHSVDSSEQAFKTAAHLALKSIFPNAKPVLLEPIMDVTLTIPNEAMGDAMGDLNTRRAHIEGMDETTIHAKLPLAELAGLVSSLQSFTKGQGTLESSFHAYQEVPAHLQAKLLETLKAQEAAEV
jgi:elongation factor G